MIIPFAATALLLLQIGCSAPPQAPLPEEQATLALALPLPKPLAQVVHRVVATLEGPGMTPIALELAHSPLGPATGIMGALPPGEGRTLSIEGFDLDGALLFVGVAEDIAIVPGDTARVALELTLAGAPPLGLSLPIDTDPP